MLNYKILILLFISFIIVSGCIFNDSEESDEIKNEYSDWQICLCIENIWFTWEKIPRIMELSLGERIEFIDGNFSNLIFCVDFVPNSILNFSIKLFSLPNGELVKVYGNQSYIKGIIKITGEHLSINLIPYLQYNYSIVKVMDYSIDQYRILTEGDEGRIQFSIKIFSPNN